MNENHNIVYVSSDSVGTGVGRSQVLPVVQGLARLGWSMTLVTPEDKRTIHGLGAVHESTNLNHIVVPMGPSGTWGLAQRVGRIAAKLPRASLFHARSDPSFVSTMLRHPFSRVVWDVRSRWATQKQFIGGPSTAATRIAQQIERVAVHRSSALITLTQLAADDLEGQWGSVPSLRLVLPTLTDTSHFRFDPSIPNRPMRLLFSGSFNRFYDIELAWKFCCAVSEQTQVETAWAREASSPPSDLEHLDLNHVMASTYADLPNLIAGSTVGLSVCRLDAGPSLRAAVPTKIGEFLSTGRPIVINQGLGGLDEMIRVNRIGIVINSAGNEHLKLKAAELLSLLDDPDLARRCRNVALGYFDLSRGVRKISSLYDGVLHSQEHEVVE